MRRKISFELMFGSECHWMASRTASRSSPILHPSRALVAKYPSKARSRTRFRTRSSFTATPPRSMRAATRSLTSGRAVFPRRCCACRRARSQWRTPTNDSRSSRHRKQLARPLPHVGATGGSSDSLVDLPDPKAVFLEPRCAPSSSFASSEENVQTRRPWVESVAANGCPVRTRPRPDLPTPESPTRTTFAVL